MAIAKKVVNYTDEQVKSMVALYTENPNADTVKKIADDMGKTTRSIIAKLSREKVYIAKPRTTKSGAEIVSKSDLVKAIEDHLDIEIPTLSKAGKADLQRLVDALVPAADPAQVEQAKQDAVTDKVERAKAMLTADQSVPTVKQDDGIDF